MEKSPARVTRVGGRPTWWGPLMGIVDPRRDAYALIKKGEDRYHQGRTSDDAGPRPTQKD